MHECKGQKEDGIDCDIGMILRGNINGLNDR